MGFIGGVLRLRLWLQIVTVALLVVCANYVLSSAAADTGAQSPVQIAALSAPAASASSVGGYSRSTVASFRYGSGAANLGLRTGPERRPVGPVSLAVGAGGKLFVADVANGRIQMLGADGKTARSVPVNSSLHDLAADDSNTLYALSTDGAVTSYDATTGKQTDRWVLSPNLAKSLGQLHAQADAVSLEAPDQKSYPVLTAAGPVGSKAQEAGQKKGSRAVSGYRYSTSYRDQGHLYRLDAQGKIVLDVALRLPDVASVNFLGEDKSGAAYVVVERLSAKKQVSVEVRKFESDGTLAATVSVPPVTYVEMTRSLVVTDSGDIYELLPEANGASILRWRKP